jgi:hypothetical protein
MKQLITKFIVMLLLISLVINKTVITIEHKSTLGIESSTHLLIVASGSNLKVYDDLFNYITVYREVPRGNMSNGLDTSFEFIHKSKKKTEVVETFITAKNDIVADLLKLFGLNPTNEAGLDLSKFNEDDLNANFEMITTATTKEYSRTMNGYYELSITNKRKKKFH